MIKFKLFLSVFFIGADILSITIAGSNFRFIQFLLPIFAFKLIFYRRIFLNREILAFLLMLFCFSFSLYDSSNLLKSLMYVFWLIFNYFFVYLYFKYYGDLYKKELYEIIIIVCRLQIIVAIILVVIGVHERAQIFFYEPSYFGMFLLIFGSCIAAQVIKNDYSKFFLFDLILFLISLVFTQSMTQSIGVFFLLICIIILKINNKKQFIYLIVFLTIFSFVISKLLLLFLGDTNNLLIKTFFNIFTFNDIDSIIDFIIDRGGNRVPRMLCAFDIWKNNFWTGIGLGAYESYLQNIDTSIYLRGIYPWEESIEDRPPINIFLELLSTTGVIGLFGFVLFFIISGKNLWFLKYDTISLSYLLSFITFVFVLNFESNFLRLYFWMIFGLLIGSTSSILKEK